LNADFVPVTVRATADVAPRPAFEAAASVDLAKIFTGFGPLPAVVGVRDQTGSWDHVGVSRRPVLSDGTAAFELITQYEPHSHFAYEVSGFTNALGRFVTGARGSWTFEPTADGGTAIEWTYAFRSRRLRRTLVRLVIAPVWRLYMRRALDATVRELRRLDAAGSARAL
jgi:hypothetical protein